jgi:hypothetical protein
VQALLRGPAALGTWLAASGVDLAPARRELAAALVEALAGRTVEARAALDRATSAGLAPAERSSVERLLEPESGSLVAWHASPLIRAGEVQALAAGAAEDFARGRPAAAAAAYSRLLLGEIDAPWPPDPERLAGWSAHLAETQRGHRWNKRGEWAAHEITVKPGDSLISVRKRAIAERPGLYVCTGLIARANQLAGDTIHPGARLRVPTDPVSVLVDLGAFWTFYLAGGEVVAAWPVGVGKEGTATHAGTYVVGERMVKNPMWFPQGREPVPFGDPENPLGTRWIPWVRADGQETGLGFHGTNEPESIGRAASLGCIRMRQEDVEELYRILPAGAPVRVVP